VTADLSPFEARTGSGLTCQHCDHPVASPAGISPEVAAMFRARHNEAACTIEETTP
jgi:hypothetical protein